MYRSLINFSINRPKFTLVLAAFLVIISLLFSSGIEIKTSNLDLIDNSQEEVARFLKYSETFGTPNSLLVVFEGDNEKDLKKAIQLSAPKIRSIGGVRKVIDRVPTSQEDMLEDNSASYFNVEGNGAYFLYVQPENVRTEVSEINPLVISIKEQVEQIVAPLNVKVGFTGIPQYALDDQQLIAGDMAFLSIVSSIFIVLICMYGFHSFRAPIFVSISLIGGIAVCLAFVRIYPGYLTLLSSPFVMLTFGLGIDYGIHAVSLMEDLIIREGLSVRNAISKSFEELKGTLLTSSLTTSGVFFLLYFSGFKGFKELGIIAGISILLSLVVMISVLPALLMISPPKRKDSLVYNESGFFFKLVRTLSPTLGPVLLLSCLFVFFIPAPQFDSDYLNLQPKDSNTVRLERMIVNHSKFSPYFVAFTLSDLAEVKTLVSVLKKEETVGEVKSAVDLLKIFNGTLPKEFSGIFDSERSGGGGGKYSVIAFPSRNIWDKQFESQFLGRMKEINSEATGLPFIGRLMLENTKDALKRTEWLAVILIVLLVFFDFKDIFMTVLVVMPPILSVVWLKLFMSVTGLLYNPLNIMAIPIILGTAIDNSVHIAHRFKVEKGDMAHTLRGAGRSIILVWLTTLAGFIGLVFTHHEGLKSFGVLLSLGTSFSLLFSLICLPWCLNLYSKLAYTRVFSEHK